MLSKYKYKSQVLRHDNILQRVKKIFVEFLFYLNVTLLE